MTYTLGLLFSYIYCTAIASKLSLIWSVYDHPNFSIFKVKVSIYHTLLSHHINLKKLTKNAIVLKILIFIALVSFIST